MPTIRATLDAAAAGHLETVIGLGDYPNRSTAVAAALENFAHHLQERNGQKRLDAERPSHWTAEETHTLKTFLSSRGDWKDCPKGPNSKPTQCGRCHQFYVCAARLLPNRDAAAIKQKAYRIRRAK